MLNYSGRKCTDPEVLCHKLIVSELIICPKLAEIKSQNVLNPGYGCGLNFPLAPEERKRLLLSRMNVQLKTCLEAHT